MARFPSDYSTGKRNVPRPDSAGILKVPVFLVMPAALAVGDLLPLTKVQPGVRLVDYDIFAPQLDSNGAPTLAFSIGVENAGLTDLATVYETALIPGRGANGSIWRCQSPLASLDPLYTTEQSMALKVTTAAATAALAGKTVLVLMHLLS